MMKLLLLSVASSLWLSRASGSFQCYSCVGNKKVETESSVDLKLYGKGILSVYNGSEGSILPAQSAYCSDPSKATAQSPVPTVSCTTTCFTAFYTNVTTPGQSGSTQYSDVIRGCGDVLLPGVKIYQKVGCCSNITLGTTSTSPITGTFNACPCNTGSLCNAGTMSALMPGGVANECYNACAGVTCTNGKTCSSPNGVSYECGRFDKNKQNQQPSMTVGTAKPIMPTTSMPPTTNPPTTAAPPPATTGQPANTASTGAPMPTGGSSTMAPAPPMANTTMAPPPATTGAPNHSNSSSPTMPPMGPTTAPPANGNGTNATTQPPPPPTTQPTKTTTLAPTTQPPTTQGAAGLWSSLFLGVTATLLLATRLL